MFASEIKRKRSSSLRRRTLWRWRLGEVYVKINGETHYPWRAVDHEGEVLESLASKTRSALRKRPWRIRRHFLLRCLGMKRGAVAPSTYEAPPASRILADITMRDTAPASSPMSKPPPAQCRPESLQDFPGLDA
ncbi:DDE-type integrase/transposase/recombinase [Phenylobacterium immobile]|uniref:DDE-type integrase/transposase/recombinase n=1 Tax=Phenylobacterium immobile TaxID=21 RepID=UPI000B8178E0